MSPQSFADSPQRIADSRLLQWKCKSQTKWSISISRFCRRGRACPYPPGRPQGYAPTNLDKGYAPTNLDILSIVTINHVHEPNPVPPSAEVDFILREGINWSVKILFW